MSDLPTIVLVFKTSIADEALAAFLSKYIGELMHVQRVTFDLEDVDNILRVEASEDVSVQIIQQLTGMGIFCRELEH